MPIDPASLDPDPFRQFDAWLTEARAADLPLPDAFALATADRDGGPSVRMLLLRGHGPDGLQFYTNRASRKGRDLAANPPANPPAPQAAPAAPALAAPVESAAYFADRPRGSQLSAWASDQGKPIAGRDALEAAVAAADARFPGDVPLPTDWGGYRLLPERFEFWVSREDRLHDRVEYVRERDGSWTRRRLQP